METEITDQTTFAFFDPFQVKSQETMKRLPNSESKGKHLNIKGLIHSFISTLKLRKEEEHLKRETSNNLFPTDCGNSVRGKYICPLGRWLIDQL